ncbi:MAG: glycine-rich domain-containing protein [Candidatus Methylumidiphilus sp.]
MDNRKFYANASATPPTPPTSPSIGYPSAGNPSIGQDASIAGPYWRHQIGEELRAVVVAANITPSDTTLTQVRDAIALLIAKNTPILLAYQTPGTFTYTVPTGRHWVRVRVIGAGGGSAKATSASHGEGGGGGAYAEKVIQVTPGDELTIAVGAGGVGLIASSGHAGNGGDSSVSTGAHEVVGGGGLGAVIIDSSGGGCGMGGIATGGDLNLVGQAGGDGASTVTFAPGGSAAGPYGGAGGNISIDAMSGAFPGGGASATPTAVSAGANGMVVLEL